MQLFDVIDAIAIDGDEETLSYERVHFAVLVVTVACLLQKLASERLYQRERQMDAVNGDSAANAVNGNRSAPSRKAATPELRSADVSGQKPTDEL